MSKKPKIKIQKVYPSIKAYESDDKTIEKASGLPQNRQTPTDKEIGRVSKNNASKRLRRPKIKRLAN